ncbi:MAG: retropepsin-like aspartic protease [Vulcanimicrobiaceae bacterium]
MRWLCLLAVVLLVGATPVKSDLLLLAAQSSGSPWRFHIVSRIAGTQTQVDEEGETVVTRRCRGVVCQGTVVNAARARVSFFWYNETPVLQSTELDPLQTTLRAIVSYAFTSPAFTANGGTVVALAQRRMGDAEVAPYAVTAPHGAELDALLDTASGLLVGVAQGHDAIYRYEDQRRVGPLMLPFNISRGDGTSETFEDRRVVDTPLIAPSGPPVTFARGHETLALEAGILPRFPCRIENVVARCVLDTGAPGLAMSLDLADQLGKKLVGEMELEGLGTMSSGVVRADSLTLGSMRIGPALFAILPDVGGFGADVIVGSDAIARAIVHVDPQHRTIAFDPPGSQIEGTHVPLTFDGFTPSVPIRLEGSAESFVLDTGDNASIDLSKEFARARPDLIVTKARTNIVGVGGVATRAVGHIGQVEFAGISLTNVLADVTNAPRSPASRVGSAFLSHFAFDLDYTELRMSVRPPR